MVTFKQALGQRKHKHQIFMFSLHQTTYIKR